ncbi:MAG: hypothetical protein R2784_05855 [Saprospiraceae bacterium]
MIHNVLCYATVQPMPWYGGTAPYTYQWNTEVQPNHCTPTTRNFTVTATDAQGCTAVGSGIVGEPPPIVIDLDITHPDCQSGLNGFITASLSGGVPGYSVLWNTGGYDTYHFQSYCRYLHFIGNRW